MFDFEFTRAQIKTFVSVHDVFMKYASSTKSIAGRYKCPFNPSEDRYNFVIKGRSWRCFSCGTSGDEISFVQKMFDLSPVDAIKKIAMDFGINTEVNSEDSKRLQKEIQRREQQRKKDQQKADNLIKIQKQLYCYIINKIREFEEEINKHKPYSVNNLASYKLTQHPEQYMHALYSLNKYNYYADILSEQRTNSDDDMFDTAITKEDLHNRMVKFIEKVYKGEIIL